MVAFRPESLGQLCGSDGLTGILLMAHTFLQGMQPGGGKKSLKTHRTGSQQKNWESPHVGIVQPFPLLHNAGFLTQETMAIVLVYRRLPIK